MLFFLPSQIFFFLLLFCLVNTPMYILNIARATKKTIMKELSFLTTITILNQLYLQEKTVFI